MEPEFDRPFKPLEIAAPTLAQFPLQSMAAQLRSEATYREHGVDALTLVRTEALTIVLTVVRAGRVLGEHHTPTAGALLPLEGSITVRPDREGGDNRAGPGALVAIGHDVRHRIRAEEDAAVLTILGHQHGIRAPFAPGPRG